jgi:hypothetical protein
MSNGTSDARWVTILAWCLVRSDEVFRAIGERYVETRAQQNARYAWLRPLELMWVARTIALTSDWSERALPGQRRVGPWVSANGKKPERFGMSYDQYARYRQSGVYGRYRVGLRKWPGMTTDGDGWTPAEACTELAEWLDNRLGHARPSFSLAGDEASGSVAKRMRNAPDRWWLTEWPSWSQRGRGADSNTLPRPRVESSMLPEARLLRPILFGDDSCGQRRTQMARVAAKRSSASHWQICKELSTSFGGDPALSGLPQFLRLADAGMELMDQVALVLKGNPFVPLRDAIRAPEMTEYIKQLVDAASAFKADAALEGLSSSAATRFADAIPARGTGDVLRALLQYHEVHGGGNRWFVLRGEKIEVRVPSSRGSSRYGFRLRQLCRIAEQCGVIASLPNSLRFEPRLATPDDEGAGADD